MYTSEICFLTPEEKVHPFKAVNGQAGGPIKSIIKAVTEKGYGA